MTVTRFAPSPTGLLHTGHAYAAKVAHDLAKESGGQFLLRFEDIDSTRVREEYYEAIEEDLLWLGLEWDDAPLRQSDRLEAYGDALDRLRELGLVYPCFCTRREIEEEITRMASAPHGPEGPLYPGTCRALTLAESHDRIASGELPAWRLHATAAARVTGPLTFSDRRFGSVQVDPTALGDVVLARKDIGTSYHLAVVVDDAFQKVTRVTRGEDLLASTHIHRMLQSLLEFPEPEYFHHALITDEHGQRLAKRDRSRTIRSLRECGDSPSRIFASFPK
ncbi:tRNA glutamyl-Q(34) synthetase GluQRS [Haloferula chungangensis]|uniref:tRNA glutamyl-Q(34) synthetase GluQRS n=1 Tax=Haloferula chungangensis TaxID=1048331 RepID=A0ABW2L6D2_9BACT